MPFDFKALPTWQKGGIIAGGAGVLYFGYKWYKGRSTAAATTDTGTNAAAGQGGFDPLGEWAALQGGSGSPSPAPATGRPPEPYHTKIPGYTMVWDAIHNAWIYKKNPAPPAHNPPPKTKPPVGGPKGGPPPKNYHPPGRPRPVAGAGRGGGRQHRQ